MAIAVGWMAGTAIRDMNGVIAAAAFSCDVSAALLVVVANATLTRYTKKKPPKQQKSDEKMTSGNASKKRV